MTGVISTSSSTIPTSSSLQPHMVSPGRRATNPDELTSAVRQALDRDGPSLIEVPDRWRYLRDVANPVRLEAGTLVQVGADHLSVTAAAQQPEYTLVDRELDCAH